MPVDNDLGDFVFAIVKDANANVEGYFAELSELSRKVLVSSFTFAFAVRFDLATFRNVIWAWAATGRMSAKKVQVLRTWLRRTPPQLHQKSA
jgi:hypothetical protein